MARAFTRQRLPAAQKTAPPVWHRRMFTSSSGSLQLTVPPRPRLRSSSEDAAEAPIGTANEWPYKRSPRPELLGGSKGSLLPSQTSCGQRSSAAHYASTDRGSPRTPLRQDPAFPIQANASGRRSYEKGTKMIANQDRLSRANPI